MLDIKYVYEVDKIEFSICKKNGKISIAMERPATPDEPGIFLSCPLSEDVADILGRLLLKEKNNEV